MKRQRRHLRLEHWEAYQTTQYPRIFVGMAAIGLLGYLSSLIIRGIARLVVRWEVS